jgi:outermembrane protein
VISLKKRGFSLIEIIIVIAIIVSFTAYRISFCATNYVNERSDAYQLKYVCEYCRKYSCSSGQTIRLYIKKDSKEKYCYIVRDIGNQIIYEGSLSKNVILYSGKDKKNLVPINDICIGYNHHHAFEKNGIMSVYIGSNKDFGVFFKMTIVPISGRVLISEEKE